MRNFPPGQHGQKRTRRPSEYGLQLREKQKIRKMYGVLEGQFRRHFVEAERRGGVTGENLLQILEMRLDNVVYRLGFADSRKQARQIVRHGHFTVNGRKTNIPSFIVKPEDHVAVRQQSREREYFKIVAETAGSKQTPDWLTREMENLSGRVVSAPTRDQIEIPPVNEQLVVEFYSR